MSVLSPEHVWILVAVIAGATVIACLRLIGHAAHDAIRWHDLRVEVQRIRSEQARRLDKLSRIEAGVGQRPRRDRRSLPANLREPFAADAAHVVEAEAGDVAEAVELAAAA